ncbi:aminotransferase class I/II-fold pyridoxal phosphate-dependent enzyme [Corynebacterium incognita]|uniref:cysteine-S-conjugate beta-lyase n=1 Tax=Corynebacterium incognita TaxID=2754725 RepID=A0A7G7CQX6_9CORY|nr:aminotransferase class I/II-fold pyridoxal phosphate-dependent enzyme [Corynebacterium incognita]QNE89992.1 aminotransferase class I/II-fold pyridoxal phosphate-dependent enzyme [Corynebacterium incognita]
MKQLGLEQLRARQTAKWTVFEDDVLPLWIAESDFPIAPEVKSAVAAAVEADTVGYPPAPAATNFGLAVADFYEVRYGWRPNPDNVMWIGDVVRGLNLAITYFTRPDSAVVAPAPAYPPFLALPEATGREMITVSAEGGLDLGQIEEAFARGAGSILLCSPHNPLGYNHDEVTLFHLVELAERYDARVLVDEIHAPLVLDGQHIPVASLGEKAARRCITVTSTSKAWNVAGLKCAQMIFSNPEDVTRWAQLPHIIKDGTSPLGIVAAEAAYSRARRHVDEQVEELRRLRDQAYDLLTAQIPGIVATRPSATYLMWLDFSGTAIGDEEHPARWLRQHARVALNEGTDFGPGGAHHARLNFATTPEILEKAITRMAAAIERA